MVTTLSARSTTAFSVAFFAAVLAGNAGMPGLLAIRQNLVIPSPRGSASPLQQLASNVLGRAVGLVLIGVIADQLGDMRLTLLVLAPTALVIAAICAFFGTASMPRDVASMDENWAQLSRVSAGAGRGIGGHRL